MPNQASERLVRLNEKIMKLWEERALEEVNAAIHQKSLVLRDSLPEFLGQIASALSTRVNRTEIRIKWDLQESTRVGRKHGRERAGSKSYTMDQLIFEYHILRQVIFEVMEQDAPLTDVQREVIICAVEQAVNDAATEFSDTLRDIQEKFTQTLAHDLRSPITAAKISAQLLLRKPGDIDHCITVATRISASMDRVDLMIHDLLDAGRLRAGQSLELNLDECDLDVILRQAVEEVNFTHGDRIHYTTSGSMIGFWDEKALRRLIDNLVSNAIKFSRPESPIRLDLQGTDSRVTFSVQNQGKVIPPEEKSILFEQFRRARTSVGKAGWGIGLSVVKGLAEAHLGQIEVESTEASGTSFKISLPRFPKKADSNARQEPPAIQSSG